MLEKRNFTMKQEEKHPKAQRGRKKVLLYKPRKKKSFEEDAAIKYLQGQYEKVKILRLVTIP